MSSWRGTPSSCAQTRGWTPNWWTDWCCSWTGSTPRYSATRKPTGSLLITFNTVSTWTHPVLTVLQLNLLYNTQWFNSVCVPLQFRNLSVPTKVRFAELLKHLHWKGDEACHEFYRGLHIHAEDVYSLLPSRVIQRGKNCEIVGQLPRCPIIVHPLLCICPVWSYVGLSCSRYREQPMCRLDCSSCIGCDRLVYPLIIFTCCFREGWSKVD